jgi:hypothetical protein
MQSAWASVGDRRALSSSISLLVIEKSYIVRWGEGSGRSGRTRPLWPTFRSSRSYAYATSRSGGHRRANSVSLYKAGLTWCGDEQLTDITSILSHPLQGHAVSAMLADKAARPPLSFAIPARVPISPARPFFVPTLVSPCRYYHAVWIPRTRKSLRRGSTVRRKECFFRQMHSEWV